MESVYIYDELTGIELEFDPNPHSLCNGKLRIGRIDSVKKLAGEEYKKELLYLTYISDFVELKSIMDIFIPNVPSKEKIRLALAYFHIFDF